jgi:peptidoglycan/LPS O-acetylase OafA/YrhL
LRGFDDGVVEDKGVAVSRNPPTGVLGRVMRTYFYAVDGVRFAAALVVCLFHLSFYAWASDGSTTAHMFVHAGAFPALTPWTWFGWVGVEVFFVISGFVIANSANGETPIAFVKSRMLRLLPAAWICATITLTAWLIAGHPIGEMLQPYLRSLLLWRKGPWIDGAYWSLAVEIAFYTLIFVMLALQRFELLPALAWGLTLINGLYLIASLPQAQAVLADNWIWRALASNAEPLLLQHGVFFAVGIWLWMSSRRYMTPSNWIGLAVGLPLGAVEIAWRASAVARIEAPAAASQPLALPVLVWTAATIALIAFTRWPERFAPRSARTRAGLKWLGRATYPLYLLQNIVGAGFERAFLIRGVPPHLALGGAVASVLALSGLVASFAEPAVLRLLRAALNRAERYMVQAAFLRFLASPGGSIGAAPRAPTPGVVLE